MPGRIRESHMTAGNMFRGRMALWLAIIPGLGHLALGRRAKGTHLLACTTGILFLMIWRSDRIAHAFSSRAIDEWWRYYF